MIVSFLLFAFLLLRSLRQREKFFSSFSFAALRFDPACDLFWWAGLRDECWCCFHCDSIAQATDVVVCFGEVSDLLIVAVLPPFAVLFLCYDLLLLFGGWLICGSSLQRKLILLLFLAVVRRIAFCFRSNKNRNSSVFASTPKSGQATRGRKQQEPKFRKSFFFFRRVVVFSPRDKTQDRKFLCLMLILNVGKGCLGDVG